MKAFSVTMKPKNNQGGNTLYMVYAQRRDKKIGKLDVDVEKVLW